MKTLKLRGRVHRSFSLQCSAARNGAHFFRIRDAPCWPWKGGEKGEGALQTRSERAKRDWKSSLRSATYRFETSLKHSNRHGLMGVQTLNEASRPGWEQLCSLLIRLCLKNISLMQKSSLLQPGAGVVSAPNLHFATLTFVPSHNSMSRDSSRLHWPSES